MVKKSINLTKDYEKYLYSEEKSKNTIDKYIRDVNMFLNYKEKDTPKLCTNKKIKDLKKTITKQRLIKWKEKLKQNYAPSSVNSMLAAINNYLEYLNMKECKISPLKIQKQAFANPEKELTKSDYEKLINQARKTKHEKTAILMQTIAATGIRISELKYISVENIKRGQATIGNKGKTRKILLSKDLIKLLKNYCKSEKIHQGIIFKTKRGKPLDRSNIWKMMKALCKNVNVNPSKVYPHNLRKLFAKSFYKIEKDIGKLADLLGHSSIDTTRIYIMESGKEHIRQLDKMKLIHIRE